MAVLVVSLSNASARRSWYHQRRIETFSAVLESFNLCWEITYRNWDAYPSRDFEPYLPVMAEKPERADSIDRMHRRDQDLLRAVEKTNSSIETWSLYLDGSGARLEGATRRALDVLYGEWDYSSYLGRGGLYLPIPEEFTREWKQYLAAAHNWHRAHAAYIKRRVGKNLDAMWRFDAKSKFDVLGLTDEPRFSIE